MKKQNAPAPGIEKAQDAKADSVVFLVEQHETKKTLFRFLVYFKGKLIEAREWEPVGHVGVNFVEADDIIRDCFKVS